MNVKTLFFLLIGMLMWPCVLAWSQPGMQRGDFGQRSFQGGREDMPQNFHNQQNQQNQRIHSNMMDEMDPTMQIAQRMRQEDPESFQLFQEIRNNERDLRRLGQDYQRSSSNDQRDMIREEIRSLVRHSVKLKLQLAERQIDHVEEKLTALKKTVEERRKDMDAMVVEDVEKVLTQQEQGRRSF